MIMSQTEFDAEIKTLTKKWQKLKEKYTEEELMESVMKHRYYLLKCKAWKLASRVFFSVLIVAILYYGFMYTELFFYLTASLRFLAVNTLFKMVPYNIFEMDCLVHNPYYDPYFINEADCSCANFNSVPAAIDGNISNKAIAADYVYKNIPLIIRQGSNSPIWWSEAENAGYLKNLTTLHDFYVQKPDFAKSVACQIQTNIQLPHPNQKLLLRYLTIDESVPANDWYAIWEHCGKRQRRAFREAFGRPHFLADNIAIASSSFLIISQGYTDKNPIRLPDESQVAVICQMRGRLRFLLTPREGCENVCSIEPYVLDISEGDCFTAPILIYSIDIDFRSPPGIFNMAVLMPGSMSG